MPPVKIGWLLDTPTAGFIYAAPRPLRTTRQPPLSRRAVQACPAINELERRCFEVPIPFDLSLRCEMEGGEYRLFVVPEGTRIDDDLIKRHVTLMRPDTWRKPDVPVIQLRVPYVFVADEPVYISQFPPFLDPKHRRWPGILSAGRFPIHIWPRVLSWAFEWYELDRDLTLKRGDPWFYVFFETQHPDQRISLVEAANTPALDEYRKGLAQVVKYASNAFSLFDTALERRPATLLTEAAALRGTADDPPAA